MASIAFKDFNFGDVKEVRSLYWLLGVAPLRRLISEEKADYLRRLIFEENGNSVLRKDFIMPHSDTPRHMSVVSGNVLNSIPELLSLYEDPDLLDTVSKIVTVHDHLEPAKPYSDQKENMVATRLEGEGDTHGWHLDDPALALIICLEAPPEGHGGEVEFEPAYPRCDHFMHLNKGDGYIMRTDKTFHRVAPLRGDFRRSILNLTYHQGAEPTPNGSADLLFQP